MAERRRSRTRPELVGSDGMVTATHWLAAVNGMAALERGGNAFDAAATAAFVLQVVEPHMNGPGGEVTMVVYDAAEEEVHVVDGQGPAPKAATIGAFKDLGLELVPGTGMLAACVPASLGAWFYLLERFGTMTLRDVLTPAMAYAQHGFPALPAVSFALSSVEQRMREWWPTSAEIWLRDGVPAPGSRLTNRLLAATYDRILREAEGAGGNRRHQLERARYIVYEGFVAEAVGAFASTPVPDEHGVHTGFITSEDMAHWYPAVEPPTRLSYRDLEVCKTGPWGQGPVFLQQLALLAGYDISDMTPGSPELIHLVTECAKLAFADREAWYGDPRFVDVPVAELLDPTYNEERRRLIGEEASLELRPGSPGGREPRLPALAGQRRVEPAGVTGDPHAAERPGDTCHLDVVDRHGNMVSATPSGGWLQSSPAIPGLGFCLGTRAQMFWLEEGLASSLEPGKRPRTTLSPSLALRDGDPYLAFGTPGGDQQDQWTLLFLLYHVDFGLDLQSAVEAANWHSTHFPSSFHPRQAHPGELVIETWLAPSAGEELASRGHRVVEAPPYMLGRVTAVSRGADGFVHGAADPRGAQAYAVGH